MAQATLKPGAEPAQTAARQPSAIAAAWGRFADRINWRAVGVIVSYVLVLLLGIWIGPSIADRPFARVVQVTITGLLVGGVYSLVALGIVVINKASGVFNFAHGYMMLTGGLLFYAFYSNGSINLIASAAFFALTALIFLTMNGWRGALNPRALIIAVPVVIALTLVAQLPGPEWRLARALVGGAVGAVFMGLVTERVAIRPLIGQPLFATILMTLAVGELLHGATQMIWGSVDIALPVFQGIFDRPTWMIEGRGTMLDGNVIIDNQLVIVFGLACVTFIAFLLFFNYTNVGLAMRATAENQRLAQSVGLRVRAILAIAWAIAALLATVGGVLQGSATGLSQNMPLLALSAFPAVLLGGLESIGGAFVGGIVIGLAQEWANFIFPGTQAGTDLAPYVVLMVVLIVRPDGLFGQRRIERI